MANNVLDIWLEEAAAKAKAAGKAAGKAQGEIDAILRLVAKKALPVKIARADIEELVTKGTISRAQANAALSKLG